MNQDKLKIQLRQFFKKFMEMRIPLFVLLVAAVYAFVVWRISALQAVQPNLDAINSQLQSSTNINKATVAKIQQLQDNSVNVKALFNQARQNPFQE
jgi:hypothetical protein